MKNGSCRTSRRCCTTTRCWRASICTRWQISGDPFLREVVEDTLDYVLREMTSPDGGFYSTQDADSEGEEGKFFVWTESELRQALDGVVSNVKAVLEYWGVTSRGNFEGKNILHAADMMERVAVRNGLPIEQMRDEVAAAKTVLFTLRKNRVPPGRDDKILAAWNGMMLATFAEAARVLGHDDYRRAAVDNAQFLQREMTNDGRAAVSHAQERREQDQRLPGRLRARHRRAARTVPDHV